MFQKLRRNVFCQLALAAWAVLWIGLTAVAAMGAEHELSLAGMQRLNDISDNPEFADPDYDDRAWRLVEFPISARRAGIPDGVDVFWYRVSFELPADWDVAAPAIFIRLLQRADEIYLNGSLIGKTGTIGTRGSAMHDYPPIAPRFYPFDAALLSSDQPNILAIRVARQPFSDEAGVISGPVALVDAHQFAGQFHSERQHLATIQAFVFGLETAATALFFAALFMGVRERSVLLFGAAFVPYYLFRLDGRQFGILPGLDPVTQQYLASLWSFVTVIPLLSFVATVLDQPVGTVGRVIQIGAVITLISFPIDSLPWTVWWHLQSIMIWHVLFAAALIVMFYWSARAALLGKPFAKPMLFGLGILAGTVLVDMALPAFATEALFGMRIGEIGILLFLFCLGYIALRRLSQSEKDLVRTRSHILVAQEQERSRLARDIHDGLGQWLSTMKLKLEMLDHRAKASELSITESTTNLVDDIGHVIDDTRRIAHDLSPALLDQLGLAGAMNSHAERVAKDTGIKIKVHCDGDLDLPDELSTNFYRAFQEAVKNALSHSGGTWIDVRLSRHGHLVKMTIRDNGQGASSSQTRGQGLGLQSLKERSDLLGGRLDIRTTPGIGTTVHLSAPLP